ncbi:alpha-N-acetylgalactosaminide alpha-2,6-sialyltransferase 1-like [Notolabrus celidotus]|uniref:alpha-N-acetylgalactosaminide alpha-2,6-sialyltransferase 1-like n=1 Tax=Notolabrus celidotus TaxID=1203425 RepID=UPI00149019EB|nr:alpha-N-acetylgalactosaminide alpha-2,6-sialyltransferase 1-like [Notolabrus celidotus]
MRDGSKTGKEIDDHDYVIRMNGALIKGHEEDVRNRTSVYVHTAHSTTSRYFFKKYEYTSAPADEGIKYVMIPETMRDYQWLTGLLRRRRVNRQCPFRNSRPWTYYGGQFDERHFYVLHPDFLRYARNRFWKSCNLNANYWATVRPTNGAFAIFTALYTCDIVSAYGFITEDYNNYFFETGKTQVVFYVNHDYNLQKDTCKKLLNY